MYLLPVVFCTVLSSRYNYHAAINKASDSLRRQKHSEAQLKGCTCDETELEVQELSELLNGNHNKTIH